MAIAFYQATLEMGAFLLTSTAGLLLEIEWMHESFPAVHRSLQHFYDLEEDIKHRITLLVLLYTGTAFLAWFLFRGKPKKKRNRIRLQ